MYSCNIFYRFGYILGCISHSSFIHSFVASLQFEGQGAAGTAVKRIDKRGRKPHKPGLQRLRTSEMVVTCRYALRTVRHDETEEERHESNDGRNTHVQGPCASGRLDGEGLGCISTGGRKWTHSGKWASGQGLVQAGCTPHGAHDRF